MSRDAFGYRHRHHFHASKIAKDIGHGVVEAVQKIGELYCYKIKFNVMDIIKGIGNFLSWMMKPIELVPRLFCSPFLAFGKFVRAFHFAGDESNLCLVGHFAAWHCGPPLQPAHTTIS